MPTEHQNELFKEFERKKGGFEKIVDRIGEKRKKLYLNLPLENVVFAAIIVTMCIVTAFALGVERGKREAGARENISSREKSLPASENTDSIELGPIEVGKTGNKDDAAGEVAEPSKSPDTERYVIQLISYKEIRRAMREKKYLARSNVVASIVKSGNWYQVCAGGYKNIKEAKTALDEFKKKYKGCFIRNK